ncbi:MAG: sigma-70 family RNA polymerase sigma factor [Verrucomicrobiota bacterium]|jgi:RNA polymerase sigma factor (sigma-70 family)
MSGVVSDDAILVDACRNGDRDAFARIVARYQSLVASIAFSATGSIAQSEDVAQETFIAAWQKLESLHEPAKLRPWLCTIARHATGNALRRQQREPAQKAETIDAILNTPACDALPADAAISREEEAILWRSLAQIPATYREPLVLFYREGESVERVAEELDLSSDAVRQRLSRGRKLLEEHVTGFVEGALRRSVPGHTFTAGVISALPAQLAGASLASLGATAAKGGAAKSIGALTALTSLAGFLPGLVSSYQAYQIDMARADSGAARHAVQRFYAILAASALTPVALILVAVSLHSLAATHPALFTLIVIGVAISWIPGAAVLVALIKQRTSYDKTQPGLAENGPIFEWRTRATLFGLPLVHLRFGRSLTPGGCPVKAWVALGAAAVLHASSRPLWKLSTDLQPAFCSARLFALSCWYCSPASPMCRWRFFSAH